MRAARRIQVGPRLRGDLLQGLARRQRIRHANALGRRWQRVVGRAVQERIDAGRGDSLVAGELRATAFQVGQLDFGLQHVLLGGLVRFVLVLGDLAKLSQQLHRVGIHLKLAAGEIIVEIGRFGGFRQHQPHVADLAAGGLGFGRGDAAAKTPFAGPRELLRGLDHPPALRPDAARGDHPAEHRVFQRNHLRIALGCRPPCLADRLKRRISPLNLDDQLVQRQLGRLAKRIIRLGRREIRLFRVWLRPGGRSGTSGETAAGAASSES